MFSKTFASDKRAALRARLAESRLIRAPGAFNPLAAMQIERAGFEAVYISGAVLSADLGLPDIGLTTLSEVAARAEQIARVTDLPAILDVDTGFGEPMNVARTVRMVEERGLAAFHLEDQVNPKRCGHLDGKSVVETGEMLRRIHAASAARRDPNTVIIARTDARAVEGLEPMIARANAYLAAGADVIFTEALSGPSEWERAVAAIGGPLLANMTEFGKSELLSTDELASLGVRVAIFPVTTLRMAMQASEDVLAEIATRGTQRDMLGRMQHRKALYDLLRYEDYNAFDQSLYNFTLDGS